MYNKKALLRQIRNAYETTSDNIIGVGFGLKTVGDVRTDSQSIVFFVKEKLPPEKLKPEDILPKTISIAGVVYPCDVVQAEPFRALNGGCYNNNNQSEYEIARLQGQTEDGLLTPMRGGQEIFIFPDGWDAYGGASLGTLGFFAIDNTDDRVVGVTNTHVVIENVLYAADPIRLPSLTLPAEVIQYNPYNTIEPHPWPLTGQYYPAGCLVRDGVDYHHAGLHVKRYTPYSTQDYNYVDTALLIMNNGPFLGDGSYFVDANSYQIWQPSDLESPYTGHYPFATTEEIDALINARCYSTGRTTGPKGYCDSISESVLRITGVHVTATIGFAPGVAPEFADLIQYQSSNGWQTTYRASLPGDSGSALLADIVNQSTGTTTRKIVGIVFAGNGVIGLANRIDNVAETLDIRAWDETYQFSRSTSLSVPAPKLITEPVSAAGAMLSVTRDDQKYWHSGLTFQQYYVQWAPTDILLSNNSVLETAYGGQIIGYFSVVDNDVWDNFTYALVAGAGDEDNNSFRVIADQLQVNLPENLSDIEDIYWRRVTLLISGQHDCGETFGPMYDESMLGRSITTTGTAQLYLSSSYGPSAPDEKWPLSPRCGSGFVDNGPNNYVTINSAIVLPGDFTLECWLWPVEFSNAWDQPAALIEGQYDGENDLRTCVYLNFATSRGIYITKGASASPYGPFVTTGSNNGQSRPRLATEHWSHLAIVRKDDTVTVYVNGVIYESAPLSGTVKFKNPQLFGKYFYGFFTDFRITTVARYTGTSFTLPTGPFPHQGPASFDYETKNQYSIRVRATDSGGNYFEKPFTINILDAIEYAPTDILVKTLNDEPASSDVFNDLGVNEVILKFVTVDQDANDSFTYDLVPGEGSTHNAKFRIGNVDKLYRNDTLVAGNQYSIRVRTTDLAGMSFEKVFTLNVVVPPARPYFSLSPNYTFEASQNNPMDSLAGTLVVTSKDSASAYDDIIFELYNPTNDYPHNSLFKIDNTYNDGLVNSAQAKLLAAVNVSYTTFPAASYFTVNIRATDRRTGRYSDQSFSIGREFPTPPYLYYINSSVICWNDQYQFSAGDVVGDLAIDYDNESTAANINAQLVTTCSGTLHNNLFTLARNTQTNQWQLKIASNIDFTNSSYSYQTLYVCVKLTDSRTGLTSTSLGYISVGNCGV
jgi:hypothetical protein